MAEAAGGEAAGSGLAEAHRRLLADAAIQFDLPPWREPEPPAWIKPLSDALEGLGPHIVHIFWGVVIAGALVILFAVAKEARGVAWRLPWRRAKDARNAEPAWRPDARAARVLLDEVDALAAQGRYDAAVKLLLQRSVADIAERLPRFLRPSLTARDIAAASALPAPARDAFGEIARVAEAALFARRPVGAQGWQEARRAYRRFAFPEAWA